MPLTEIARKRLRHKTLLGSNTFLVKMVYVNKKKLCKELNLTFLELQNLQILIWNSYIMNYFNVQKLVKMIISLKYTNICNHSV